MIRLVFRISQVALTGALLLGVGGGSTVSLLAADAPVSAGAPASPVNASASAGATQHRWLRPTRGATTPTPRRTPTPAGQPSGSVQVPSGLPTAVPGPPAKPADDGLASTLPPVARPGFVARVGPQLFLDGKPYRFVGVNAYQAATVWATNIGCGAEISNLDSLFAGLHPNSMVRFWAFQSQAWNKNTRSLDFGPIDRVFAAAGRHNVKLIVTLGDQSGTCDSGHFHDQAWYRGEYQKGFNDNGRNDSPLSYLQWVNRIVPRYKDSATVGMWELMNEAESSNCNPGFSGSACIGHNVCPPQSMETLAAWFDHMGTLIKHLDPDHLVSSGTLGAGECGVWEDYWKTIHRSASIDVASVHDYDPRPESGLGARRIRDAGEIGKPLIFGESGTDANANGAGCPMSLSARGAVVQQKLDHIFGSRQVAGYLQWMWVEHGSGGCGTEVTPTDPLMPMLRSYAFPLAISLPARGIDGPL